MDVSDLLVLFSRPETYLSLVTLLFLEVVLGVDNIIFIAILAAKLPKEQQPKARLYGLSIAILGRLGMLAGIAWLTKLTTPLFHLGPLAPSGRDLILLGGGLFLIYKSAQEIYEKVESKEESELRMAGESFAAIVGQIIIIDMVFSLDSIITAVGLVNELVIMFAAVILSLFIMLAASAGIAAMLDRHPSLKILGLSFLLMIGTLLTAEAFHYEIPRGYIYSSLGFALLVQWFNILMHENQEKKNRMEQ